MATKKAKVNCVKSKESVDKGQFVLYKKVDCQNLQEKLKNNFDKKSKKK